MPVSVRSETARPRSALARTPEPALLAARPDAREARVRDELVHRPAEARERARCALAGRSVGGHRLHRRLDHGLTMLESRRRVVPTRRAASEDRRA